MNFVIKLKDREKTSFIMIYEPLYQIYWLTLDWRVLLRLIAWEKTYLLVSKFKIYWLNDSLFIRKWVIIKEKNVWIKAPKKCFKTNS
jgi:hypothetical protein